MKEGKKIRTESDSSHPLVEILRVIFLSFKFLITVLVGVSYSIQRRRLHVEERKKNDNDAVYRTPPIIQPSLRYINT